MQRSPDYGKLLPFVWGPVVSLWNHNNLLCNYPFVQICSNMDRTMLADFFLFSYCCKLLLQIIESSVDPPLLLIIIIATLQSWTWTNVFLSVVSIVGLSTKLHRSPASPARSV